MSCVKIESMVLKTETVKKPKICPIFFFYRLSQQFLLLHRQFLPDRFCLIEATGLVFETMIERF